LRRQSRCVGGLHRGRGEPLVGDERTGPTVLEDVPDLGADEVPVDRHHVQAGLDRGEERGQQGRAVGQLDGDAVAGAQAGGPQTAGDAVGLRGELAVRHDPAVRFHHGGPPRFTAGDGPQSDGGHARECITRSNH
jgi:hypothetical protein